MVKQANPTETGPAKRSDRTRARHALEAVRAFKSDHQNDADKKKYLSRIKDLGLMVRQNGIIAALVFVRSRDEAIGGRLTDQVRDHLLGVGLLPANQRDLLKHLTGCDEAAYLRLQTEAVRYTQWLKRFAVVELGVEEDFSDR